jgi:hypothetical protein
MPYSPPGPNFPFTPTTATIPSAPTISGIVNGADVGEVTVTVATPAFVPPIAQVAVFYSVLDITTMTVDELFKADPNRVRNEVKAIGPADVIAVFDLTGLAPGAPYFFVPARSTGP